MSEKSALYLSIAHRCAAKGETGRAIITIVNALRNNPKFLETQPEAVDFLAEILIPGFEEEIHRLETRFPSFGYRLYSALEAHGKTDFARKLEQSFSAYCIERMKTVQSCHNLTPVAPPPQPYIPPAQSFIPEPVPSTQNNYQQTAVESGFYKPASRSNWQKQTTGESCEKLPTIVPELPSEVWMPSIQNMAARHDGQTSYEKRKFTSRNNDVCSSDGIRRFDRIRTQSAPELKAADDYADSAADRVILDFDNRVRETPKAAIFAATKQKYRSFAEDLAEWREEARTESKRQIVTTVQNPLDVVAETTHALSDTPSVEPYTVRHPIRFHLTPQNIMTCIFVCILGMFGLFAWNSLRPDLEETAIENVSQSYLKAAEMGVSNPVEAIEDSNGKFVDDEWMKGYRLFLNVWQNLYHNNESPELVDPENPAFTSNISAAHAAYLMQEVARNHIDRAKIYFDNIPPEIWRDHHYFKTWCEAELDIAARDYRTASIRYEKLLRTPLAPFALVRMGLLSLEEGPAQIDIQQRFLKAADANAVVPCLARCIHATLDHSNGLHISQQETANLKFPFSEYCSMGRVFTAIHNKDLIDPADLQFLEQSVPLQHGESYRLEAIIEGKLYQQQAAGAVDFYQTLDLPQNHPLRKRLLNNILSRTLFFGNWNSLNALNPRVQPDINYMTAARIIDNARTTGIVEPDGKRAESLFIYEASPAPAAINTLMDEAIVEAETGHFNRALTIVQSILSNQPDNLEPLFLQALILSQMGMAQDAAHILEQAMMTGNAAAPLIVLSNLYRVRGNLALNRAAFTLQFISYSDPVLESARCEILWRQNDSRANTCLNQLAQRNGKQTKAAWIMQHLDERRMPIGKHQQWAKASSGSLSFPGFHLAYARKLIEASDFNNAAKAYTKAILRDTSTATPEVIDEFAKAYSARQRRYEGTKKFEELITESERLHRHPEIMGALHLGAAMLYQPENGHSTARQHLGIALELLGDRPEILRGLVQYYEAKDKPEQAATWRGRLNRILKQ